MPDAPEKLPAYEKAILQTIAYKHVRETLSHTLKAFQINATQWMMLGILATEPAAQKISSLAKTLQVEVPLITTLAQPLLAIGLVEQQADVLDRRSKPLVLTEAGKGMVAKIDEQLSVELELLEGGLNDDQVQQYFQTLRTIILNAEKLDENR